MQNENAAAGLTLEQLNDDCLECIFQRLQELPSQLQAARTCKRFRDINARIWHRNSAYHTLCLEEWRDMLTQHEDLQYFLEIVRDWLQTVRVSDECLGAFLKDLEELGISYLPSVQRLEVAWSDCYPSDMDIKSLTELLPHLKYLKLTSPITGRYLVNFTELEELHLYEDQEKEYEIKHEHLKEICEQLQHLRVLDIRAYEFSNLVPTHVPKCQHLEVLKLNLSALKPILPDVLQLPHLKTLTVLLDQVIDVSRIQNVDTHDYKIYETAEFFHIFAAKAEHISGVAIDNYFLPLTSSWDERLTAWPSGRLRKFAFCNCEFADPLFLEKYARKSPELELLCLRHCTGLSNELVLLFVKLCPQLRHLDVSYCINLDKALLHATLDILKQRQREKICDASDSHSLCLYYLRSGLEFEIERVNPTFWRTQQLLQLSTDLPPNSDQGLSYVQRGYEFDFC